MAIQDQLQGVLEASAQSRFTVSSPPAPLQAPAAPNPYITLNERGEIDAAWGQSQGANNYIFEHTDAEGDLASPNVPYGSVYANGQYGVQINLGDVTSVRITGLYTGGPGDFHFRVGACNGAGCGWSNVIAVYTQ